MLLLAYWRERGIGNSMQNQYFDKDARRGIANSSAAPSVATLSQATHGETVRSEPFIPMEASASSVYELEPGARFLSGDCLFKVASYRQETSRFAGNAFVEALPPLPTAKEAWKALRHLPPARDAEFYSQPIHQRLEALYDINDIFVPTDEHAEELQEIMSLVRRGLLYRNPTSPEVMAHIYRCARYSEDDWKSGKATKLLTSLNPAGGSAAGHLLFGATGTGKTTLTNRIVQYIDRTPIVHTSIGGRPIRTVQLPLISVQCEKGSDLKGMVRKILENFDSTLGTEYAKVGASVPLWSHLSQLYRAATSNHLGLLILDDLQRLKALDEKTEATLQAFSTFMQATGIPILSVATSGVKDLLVAHIQEGRKLMSEGRQELTHLPLDKDFQRLCTMMWQYRVSHAQMALPDFFASVVHHHTQGFLHALKLLVPAVFKALAKAEGKASFSVEMIDECAKAVLPDYEGSIKILRLVAAGETPNPEQYKQFEHLLPLLKDDIPTFAEGQARAVHRAQEQKFAADRLAAEHANAAEAGDADKVPTTEVKSGRKHKPRSQAGKRRPAKKASGSEPNLSYDEAVKRGFISDILD